MPTYRSITISLVSQLDILTIPEYAPPATSSDPFIDAPTLVDQSRSLVSVHIPIYPGSQFWILYSVAPPHPPGLLFYFKLFLGATEIASWACGRRDEYRGKTSFGLFAGEQEDGTDVVERRALRFVGTSSSVTTPVATNGHTMEIRVFRARGRTRAECDLQSCAVPTRNGLQAPSSMELVNAGVHPKTIPLRYYKYALLDAVDNPFATFRYYCQPWEELQALGVIPKHPQPDAFWSGSDESAETDSQEEVTLSSPHSVHSIGDIHRNAEYMHTPSASHDISPLKLPRPPLVSQGARPPTPPAHTSTPGTCTSPKNITHSTAQERFASIIRQASHETLPPISLTTSIEQENAVEEAGGLSATGRKLWGKLTLPLPLPALKKGRPGQVEL